MLVSEIGNILLTGALLPVVPPSQKPFATISAAALHEGDTVPADHTRRLLAGPLPDLASRQLASSAQGRKTLEDVQSTAVKWLSELMEPTFDGHHEDGSRRDSLITIGGAVDEEVELIVTVLVSCSSARKLISTAPTERSELASRRARLGTSG